MKIQHTRHTKTPLESILLFIEETFLTDPYNDLDSITIRDKCVTLMEFLEFAEHIEYSSVYIIDVAAPYGTPLADGYRELKISFMKRNNDYYTHVTYIFNSDIPYFNVTVTHS